MSVVENATRVRAEVERTMDARLHNIDQDKRLVNLATEEEDSAIERVRGLRKRPLPRHDGLYVVTEKQVDALEDDMWFLVESNGREGKIERRVAGALEGIAAELYSTAGRLKIDACEIAKRLRPVLKTIGAQLDPAKPDPSANERALAWVAWGSICKQVPERTLAGRRLANELGVGATRTLARLLSMEEATRDA